MNANLSQRVLATGGAGFIGIPVVKELLSQGYKVAIFDKFLFPERYELIPKDPSISVFAGDLLNRDRIKEIVEIFQPTIIFHH